jgi:hypothetical protein
MDKTDPHVDSDPELNPEVRFEPTDIDMTSLVVFGAVMFVLLVVVFTLMWFMLKYWQAYDLQAATARYGEPSPLVGKMPESPQLGGLRPLKELQAWRAPGDAILESTAWVDPKSRIVRIPIDQAIDEFVREQ